MDLSSLFNWILSILRDLSPFVIIKEWQQGILLRFGKFKRVLHKGLHFKIPFVDDYISHHITITTLSLPPQSLYTKDGKSIVVKGLIKFKVVDIKTFLLDIYEANDGLSDITQSIIKSIIMERDFLDCLNNTLDNTITKKVRVAVSKYGMEIEQITLTDIAPIRTIRLMNDSLNHKLKENA